MSSCRRHHNTHPWDTYEVVQVAVVDTVVKNGVPDLAGGEALGGARTLLRDGRVTMSACGEWRFWCCETQSTTWINGKFMNTRSGYYFNATHQRSTQWTADHTVKKCTECVQSEISCPLQYTKRRIRYFVGDMVRHLALRTTESCYDRPTTARVIKTSNRGRPKSMCWSTCWSCYLRQPSPAQAVIPPQEP